MNDQAMPLINRLRQLASKKVPKQCEKIQRNDTSVNENSRRGSRGALNWCNFPYMFRNSSGDFDN